MTRSRTNKTGTANTTNTTGTTNITGTTNTTNTTTIKTINSMPWIEKYRPSDIDKVVYDDNTKRLVDVFLSDTPNVHLIISGIPGTGKTTTARCIAKKILGDNYEEGYMEINAAEERGADDATSIIPPFCKKMKNFTTSCIILLDEADNLTSKSQSNLLKILKIYGENTKFIFTCNNSENISQDIQSICALVRFKAMSENHIIQHLATICNKENVEYDQEGLATIYYISRGDMRKAINDLQKTAYTYSSVNKTNVLEICKIPDPSDVLCIIDDCKNYDLTVAIEKLDKLIVAGYNCLDIVNAFIYVFTRITNLPNTKTIAQGNLSMTNSSINEELKLQLIDIVNNTKILIVSGLRSRLQLVAMISRIVQQIKQFNDSH